MRRKKNMFGSSNNPFFSEDTYAQQSKNRSEVLDAGIIRADSERMTVQGAINKSLVLGLIMLFTAGIGFTMASPIMYWGGAIGSLIVVLITARKPHLSPTLAPIYAGLEGLFVGAISAAFAGFQNGLIFQAVSLTMAVFFAMLFLYKSGTIKVTAKFRSGVIMATMAIMMVYLLNLVLHLFGINMPYLHEGGMIGIGISLVIIGVAAMNLLLDFDNFDKGARYGAPKYMEWFSAMGLLITLVWLYVEILRLLAVLSSNE